MIKIVKYIAKLKRKGVGIIEIEVEDGKFNFKKDEPLFAPVETAAIIKQTIIILEREGLEWLRVEESP